MVMDNLGPLQLVAYGGNIYGEGISCEMIGFPVFCDDHGVFDIRALAFFAEFLEPGFYCFIIIIRYIRLPSHGHMVITVRRPASSEAFDGL